MLAAWSGLGYYRRARMLHAAAKVVVRELGGKFPASSEGLRELPGIGRYTAAAIASIAFGEAVAVVDGNVERVLQRVSGKQLAGEEFWAAAEKLLDRERPGDFNQAMMELGATICTPRTPACLTCPVVASCATRGEMEGVSKAAQQKKREIDYALDYRGDGGRGGKVFLVQRARDASLMAGMWELPEVAVSGAKAPSNGWGEIAALKALRHPKAKHEGSRSGAGKHGASKFGPILPSDITGEDAGGVGSQLLFTLKHSITVTDYTVQVWRRAQGGVGGKWVPVERLGRVALTGLARKILRRAKILQDAAANHDRPGIHAQE